jgi:tRNA-dihydrouridine synthase
LRSGSDAPAERRRIPLSIKTRIGYERDAISEWIPTLLEEQPAAITLHGRTLQQGYKGNADWDAIARAAELARGSGTLMIGNGDVQDLRDAHQRIRDSGVDGLLIGRAAQGNPWLFAEKEQVKRALQEDGTVTAQPPISIEQRFHIVREHSRHYENIVQIRCFVGMRKHLIWYCRDFRGAAEMRSQMVRLSSAAEVDRCLENYSETLAKSSLGLSPSAAAVTLDATVSA